MIKISPFSPLFFSPSTDKYGVESRHIQLFATEDNIVVQVLADGGESVSGVLKNIISDAVTEINFSKLKMSSTVMVYTATLSQLSSGYYSIAVNDLESDIFHVTDDQTKLECTSLIKYTSSTNRLRSDVVFINGSEQYKFMFRVPGGFKDNDWAFQVNNEQFETADGNIVELFAVESTAKTFTMGDSYGCPIWFGEHLNRILCCTHVHINGVRYVRKGNSTPEVTQELPGQKSYIFKVQLQGMVENVNIELPSSTEDGETESEGGGAGYVYLIKIGDNTRATDSNTYSALRITYELEKAIKKNNESLEGKYLRKDKEDVAQEIITFLKGLLVGQNGHGISVLEDGSTQAVVDRLYVKVKAYFDALEVKKKTFVGGEQILSPAGMKCIRVESLASAYRCYFRAEEDGVQIENEFVVGQLAICQECNVKVGVSHHVGNRFYWREVVGIGADYIDLSITTCAADSDIPAAGDDIVGLGHRDDIVRQSAIILSSVAETAPSIIFYQGINDFTLVGKEVMAIEYDRTTGHAKVRIYGDTYIGDKERSTYIEYTQEKGVDIKGSFHIEKGSTGWKNLEGLPEDVQAAADAAAKAQEAIANATVGSVNLLRNTGFTGNYAAEELDSNSSLSSDSELYSKALKFWTGIAAVNSESSSASGYSASIGSLSQTVSLIEGEYYVISFKARGTNLAISCGNYNVAQSLTADFKRYTHKFVFGGSGIFLVSGTAEICEIQLERGSIATDWKPSNLDNDKSMAEFQSLTYLVDAIKNGSVDILGGLILSSMIQLGNYKDGVMQKVNAGISGIYNSDDDVAIWAGGSFEQAIRTVMKLKYDKKNPPTDDEWEELANFVTTHGGDLFLRGYIDALGGRFRGKVETSIAGKRIVIDPASQSMTMYNEIGLETLILSFRDGGENWTWGDLQLRRYNYDAASSSYVIAFESRMTASNVDIYNRIDNTWTRITTDGCQITASTDERHYNIITSLVRKYGDNGALQYRCNVLSDCWETDATKVGAGAVYAEPQYDNDGTLISKVLKVKV